MEVEVAAPHQRPVLIGSWITSLDAYPYSRDSRPFPLLQTPEEVGSVSNRRGPIFLLSDRDRPMLGWPVSIRRPEVYFSHAFVCTGSCGCVQRVCRLS